MRWFLHGAFDFRGSIGAGGKPGAFNPGAKSQVHEDDIYATGLGGGDSRFRGGDLTDHFDVVGAF